MVEVQEIDNLDELAGYRMLWNSWLVNVPRATFVNSFDWLKLYWQHFGRLHQLRVLLVHSAGRPIGIVPLCVKLRRYRFGELRVLSYPVDDIGTWYGPLGSDPATTMLAAMRYVQRSKRDWDVIDLAPTAPATCDAGRAARSLRVVGLLTDQHLVATNSLVALQGAWNDYWETRPRTLRSTIRRVIRNIDLGHAVEYIRHRPAPSRENDGDPRWDLYSMCEYVALASWQATAQDGNTMIHPQMRDFFRESHAAAAHQGMVDVNLLLVNGRPAAFVYNYHLFGQLTVVQVGYDASSSISGLGTALLVHILQDSFERGDVSFHLGPGESQFMRAFRTHTEPSYRLVYAPFMSWRSQAVRLSEWAGRRLVTSQSRDFGKKASA